MKHYSLRTVIAARFALIVLAVVFLISIVSNFLVNKQFDKYVEEQQHTHAEDLARNISNQYNAAAGGWNLDFVHGMGMYALDEGYIIRLYDLDENVLWDAENHDMTYCHEMMDDISLRMQEKRPDINGDFVMRRFDLMQNNTIIGYLDISYYSPYYLSEDDFQFITALNQILLVVGIISLLGAVIMGLILANSITNPIARTVEITKQISEGNYNIRFKEAVKTKELQELIQAVNQMAVSLGEHDTLRKRLTSDIAHELRTPIANVSSYLEAILEGVWEPTPERLQNCYDELERLSKLISDLEQLRQVEDKSLRLQKTETDLLELAQASVTNFESQLQEKKLHCTVEGTRTIVLADRSRIQQVVTNLLSNAIKYSNENGVIHVVIKDTADAGIIQVEDEGIGIAQEELDLIFERFYRTDKSRNRKTGGAGIGLTIVKTIVQAHDGIITVESKEDCGSTFIVTLPKI